MGEFAHFLNPQVTKAVNAPDRKGMQRADATSIPFANILAESAMEKEIVCIFPPCFSKV